MKKSLLLWVPLLILLFLGCAKTPMASPERDLAAKSFAPVPGMAVVYIYRDGNDGGSIKIPLLVDHRAICDTVAKSYIRLELEPGGHIITSKGERHSILALKAEPGKVYYIWQEVKMGWVAARSMLQAMPENKGQAGIHECKLLEGPTRPLR